ncbi:MAG: CPBP family intramembrane metalloprotease [Clostridiales bacterium]|nr:CPBP family intramembrane metalloprotease [Clostridiales bacterium]
MISPLTPELKRDYRAVSLALTSAAVGLILMRIIVYFVPIDTSTYAGELSSNAIFTLFTQLVFFLAVPFCLYKFYGKRTVKETLEYSSVHGFKKYHLLAIPLGFCALVLTIGISSSWMTFLRSTGYNMPSSSADKPETLNAGYLIADIILTAMIPAVCEEFVMRGGMLTTAKSTLGLAGCVALCGLSFGLFHQNVKQVFYTAIFGATAGLLTLKLKSIFPAMIMHFTNNFFSVLLDYATDYNWAVGGNTYNFINSVAATRPWALFLIFFSVLGIAAGLVIIMFYFRERTIIKRKIETLKDSAFDTTKKRVVLMGEFDEEKVKELEMEQQVYGADYREEKYKPAPRDIMIIIAVGVVTTLTTVFTYVWGFFY